MSKLCDATTNFNSERGVTHAVIHCSLEVHEDSEWHTSKVKWSDPPAIVRWLGRAPAPKKDE